MDFNTISASWASIVTSGAATISDIDTFHFIPVCDLVSNAVVEICNYINS